MIKTKNKSIKIILLMLILFIILLIVIATDSKAPTWSNNSTNTTPQLNESIEFNVVWQDDYNMSNYWFSWNCSSSGLWINDSINLFDSNFFIFDDTEDEYNCTGTVTDTPCINAVDENLSTYFENHPASGWEDAYIYENYTLPTGIISTNWTVKYSGGFPLDVSSFAYWNNSDWVNNAPCVNTYMDGYSIRTCVIPTPYNLDSKLQTKVKIRNCFVSCGYGTGIPVNKYYDGNITFGYANYSNVSTTKIINFTRNRNHCYWKMYANDSNGNLNGTDNFRLNFNKLKPSTTISIQNKPLIFTDDINITITFVDTENDTWKLNETQWYNDSTLLSNLNNLTSISYTNTSDGETWTISARVYDGFNWSDWVNDSVVIADVTTPNTYNFSLERETMFNDETNNISINATDLLSNIGWCKFEIKKPTGTINRTATLSSSGKSVIAWYNFDEVATSGVYNVTNVYCQDTSGNLNTTIVNEIFTVSTRPTTVIGGSSGSSGTTTIIIQGESNLSVKYKNTNRADLQMTPFSNRTITLAITNLESDTLNLNLNCISNNTNVCDWVTILTPVIDIEANVFAVEFADINIALQNNITFGEEYTFSIQFVDQLNRAFVFPFKISITRGGYLFDASRKLLAPFITIQLSKIKKDAMDFDIPIYFAIIILTPLIIFILFSLSKIQYIRNIILIFYFPIIILYFIIEILKRIFNIKNKFKPKDRFWSWIRLQGNVYLLVTIPLLILILA